MSEPADDRLSFLAERRALSTQRFDTVHSPHYDEHWGAISATHCEFVHRLVKRIRAGGEVLDAACGTGKYWPILLAAGLRVVGTDQSAGMLAQARTKHPAVQTLTIALQDLMTVEELQGRFDGLLCVDALEYVGPEHWPRVATGLAGVLRSGSPAYVTVELAPASLPAAEDPRQVPGEVIEGGGYHFYPTRQQVNRWLDAAGFVVDESADGDEYWHLLLTRV